MYYSLDLEGPKGAQSAIDGAQVPGVRPGRELPGGLLSSMPQP